MVPVVVVDADASSSHGVPANRMQQQDRSNNSTSSGSGSGSGSVEAEAGPRSSASTEDSQREEPNAAENGDANNNESPNDDDSKSSNHHNDEDNTDDDDDDNDNDSQPEEDDGSSASDHSSSQSNPEMEGLSEYERLREERIRRNQQYLAQLGLDQSLAPKPVQKRKRTPAAVATDIERRSSLGRASKQKPIQYNVDEAMNFRKLLASKHATTSDSQLPQQPSTTSDGKPSKSSSSNSKKNRVPLEVYREFVRIGRQRKENMRRFHKYQRAAAKHLQYWQRRLQKYRANLQESAMKQRIKAQQELERQQLGGKTKLECWQELEKRSIDLWTVIVEFDKQEAERKKQEEAQRVEQELHQKQLELDQKLELVDALDRFPTALQETNDLLNNLLLKRAPKDPPPPRRSRRVSLDEHPPSNQLTSTDSNKKESETADTTVHNQPPHSTLDTIRAALAWKKRNATIHSTTTNTIIDQPTATIPTNNSEATTTLQPPNVGGWISPSFAESLDRSWLSREKPSDDIATTPPQPGQLFLYYPGAHKAFLLTHPDIWGTRNQTRQPLWELAATTRDSLQKSTPLQETTIQGQRHQTRGRKRRSAMSSDPVEPVQPLQRAKRQRVGAPQVSLDSPNEKTHSKAKETASIRPATQTSSSRRRNGFTDQNQSSPTVKETPFPNAHMSKEGATSPSSSRRSSSRRSKTHNQNNDQSPNPVSRRRRRSLQSPTPAENSDKNEINIGPTSVEESAAIDGHIDGTNGSQSSPTIWWTDEWIEQIDGDLGQYPILCRVERTQAEFPFDPNIHHRKVDEKGNVTWIIPDQKPAPKKSKDHETAPSVGLAIVLQPLTSVIPPTWDESSGELTDELPLPPPFSIVTFPSNNFTPFLVPFAWAYAKNHSLSLGDTVVHAWNDKDDTENSKCKVTEFLSIGTRWGSFRLDDKLRIIRSLVEKFTSTTFSEIDQALVVSGPGSTTKTSLPPEDAALIVDFLSLYLANKAHNEEHDAHPTTTKQYTLLDLIRSTLPLFGGIGVRREVFQRKVAYTAGWNLRRSKKGKDVFVVQVASLLRERLRQGVPNRLENSLRIKLRYTVKNFLDNRPEATSFMEMVTEDVAPSYYCAVPVGMHFDRILARLNVSTKNDHCYYSSAQSIIGDLQTILTNCLLYNRPDSALVTECSTLVPALQKQLVHVLSKHENERDATMMTDSERKQLELLETLKTMHPEDAAELDINDPSILATLNTPYRGLLDRSKLQILQPDSSWQDISTSRRVSWMPQCGDLVSYSHRLHANFIEENKFRLARLQQILPSFEPSIATDPLASRWLKARIVSVHATFPADTESAKENLSTPVMAIVLHFVDLGVRNSNFVQTIFWTIGASFLIPAWSSPELPNDFMDSDSIDSAIRSQGPSPQGIDGDSIRRMARIFDALKSRCLHGIDPDYVDSKLTLNNPLNDGIIKVTKPGMRNLPSFEELLAQDTNHADGKNVSTRGIRRTDDDEAIRILSEFLYLPAWTLDTLEDDLKKRKMSNYEAMMPFPNLCLEYVRLRLKQGYYRQVAGVIGDLQEAYVISSLFLLSGFASRRKNRVSTKKIAKLLHSGKVDGDGGLTSDFGISEEETSLIEQLEKSRRLYAMAILAVSDTRLLEKILGLHDKQSARGQPKHMDADSGRSEVSAAAERIRYLLAAAGREPCLNQFDNHGSIKFKISVNGETIKYKDESNSSLRTFITLGHNEYTSNDALARVLLRRPGRRAPCIRCQVYGLTFYTCRVVRSHSNPDFDFVANWKEVGGIDGMLQPFDSRLGISLPALVQESTVSNNPHSSTDDDGVIDDPTEEVEKAQEAVKIAASLDRPAVALALERVKLGTKFIQETFPVDPSDGHYIWCTICGLSGDVLCCDGCSNVVHSQCIGLSTIPDDDWFCETCLSKRHPPEIVQEPETASNQPPSAVSVGATTISTNQTNLAPLLSCHGQKKVLLTDDEFEGQVDKLGKLIDELDRKQYPFGRQRQMAITVGTVFYKTFAKFGTFKGVVVATPTESHPYCKVKYEDGDVEELEPSEIANLLRENSASNLVKADVQVTTRAPLQDRGKNPVLGSAGDAPRKRGRPRKYPPTGSVVVREPSKSSMNPVGKKRGNAAKEDYTISETSNALLQPKKKRGRPRKNPPDAENPMIPIVVPVRARGRPRKNPLQVPAMNEIGPTSTPGKRVRATSNSGPRPQPTSQNRRRSTSQRHRKPQR